MRVIWPAPWTGPIIQLTHFIGPEVFLSKAHAKNGLKTTPSWNLMKLVSFTGLVHAVNILFMNASNWISQLTALNDITDASHAKLEILTSKIIRFVRVSFL